MSIRICIDIKAILGDHEVSESAVVELKDALKGSVPFAFIIRTDGISRRFFLLSFSFNR